MEPLPLASPHIDPTAFVAPNATVLGRITIGPEAVIMFGVVMRAELDAITIGARTNVQDNSVLHVDIGIPCSLGDEVTVGHSAVVHGATIGDHCLVGIGARALNNSVLGEGAWLGAGSVLTEGKVIPPWTLALGIPAKPIRDLTDHEVSYQRAGVQGYLGFAEIYRQEFG